MYSDAWLLFSQLLFILIVAFAILIIVALLGLIYFWKTNRIFVPKVMLTIINFVESPLRSILPLLRIDDKKLDYAIITLRNNLFRPAYARTPYKDRAIFIPQCLRNPDCPAKLSPEGIQCINCGKCGLGEIKKFSEDLGCMFFIAPGGTFVKRMIKKHKPKGVVGVGCSMELREGTDMLAKIGMPGLGVLLKRSGCVDTRVNIENLMHTIALTEEDTGLSQSIKKIITDLKDNIENMWSSDECPRE